MDPNWCKNMVISTNGGTPKWMAFNDFIMKIPIQIDGLGVPVPAF